MSSCFKLVLSNIELVYHSISIFKPTVHKILLITRHHTSVGGVQLASIPHFEIEIVLISLFAECAKLFSLIVCMASFFAEFVILWCVWL